MNRPGRILYFLSGLIMVIFGILMVIPDDSNYLTVLLLLEIALILSGIRQLRYYFTMARYMVGGIYIFYKGIFLLDAGLFALNMDDVPRQYAMLYLIAGLAIGGLVSVMHALEIKRMESGKWKFQIFYGGVEIATAIICLFFLDSPEILSMVYGVGVLHGGIVRIVSSVQPAAIVYIK